MEPLPLKYSTRAIHPASCAITDQSIIAHGSTPGTKSLGSWEHTNALQLLSLRPVCGTDTPSSGLRLADHPAFYSDPIRAAATQSFGLMCISFRPNHYPPGQHLVLFKYQQVLFVY